MSVKNFITNEKINEKFDNTFSLVNHAIALARKLIDKGEEFEINPANEVLERILQGRDKDAFDESEDLEEELDDEENA